MEEARGQPPCIILLNEYFTVYENGRQKFLSGRQPSQLDGHRGIQARPTRGQKRR
jgi:hypothetical protein